MNFLYLSYIVEYIIKRKPHKGTRNMHNSLKKLIYLSFSGVALLLSACSHIPGFHPSPKAQINQICSNLKQDILLNSTLPAPEAAGQNPTKTAQFYKAYQHYNCERRLQEQSSSFETR